MLHHDWSVTVFNENKLGMEWTEEGWKSLLAMMLDFYLIGETKTADL